MRKRFFVIIMVVLMLASNPCITFANSEANETSLKELQIREKICKVEMIASTDDIVEPNIISNKKIKATNALFSVDFPTENNRQIKMKLNSENKDNITIELPKNLSESAITITESGSVVYNSTEENANLIVQATHNYRNENQSECGVRSIIVIENAKASHDYEFKFILPEGSLITGKNANKDGRIQKGKIEIIDSNGFIMGNIKAPWAKDADGKPIETFYRINGNVITQHIDFNEETKFPVIADPWYGTSTQTENIGAPETKNFTAIAAGQGSKGFFFDEKGGMLFYSRGSGATATVNIELGLSYPPVTLSVGIGFASQGLVGSGYPVTDGAGWYKLRVTEQHKVQKYKILRRWKDPDTGRVSWKEFSRNAKVVDYVGIIAKPIKQ